MKSVEPIGTGPAAVKVPRATYRLQFHAGFKLRDGLELVPYLAALGVSHLYASPLLKARPGSTHGYDVCDCTQLNPELGTEADLEALVGALREHGLGLVLDIVPNHMGIGGPENAWWWDVLARGSASSLAGYFDIDWESPDPRLRGKVLLPVLGDRYERVLERGELRLVEEGGAVRLAYFDHRFPLAAGTGPEGTEAAGAGVAEVNRRPDLLDALVQKQHYRLAFWRLGDSELNYRRFFNITTLVGVRVENPRVFSDTHSRILEWCQRGWIEGLRIDHPDGLRDPQEYLERLRAAAPGAWVVVEKILEPGEALPADWPVAGTTGYDFLNWVAGLWVDPEAEAAFTEFYAQFTGEPTDPAGLVREKKRAVLRELLAAEVEQLTHLLLHLAAHRWPIRDCRRRELREAIVEWAAAFPVYRTYGQAGRSVVSAADAACLGQALAAVRHQRPDLDSGLVEFVGALLRREVRGDVETEFSLRFQQLTGPAMAKGLEDTTFYCYNRFVALNDVGGDPARFGVDPAAFHRACAQAQASWPTAMLATSTHDTKRSEDVRARLGLLSEIPRAWFAAVRRWSALNEPRRRHGWPDRNLEYLFYQTAVGAWPWPVERALAYLEKAACEAKQHTDWTRRNAAYEAALRDFVSGALGDPAFVDDLERFVAPLVGPGRLNALAQTLVKLTAPGVPDLYQGTELWELSLVDPDNRRPVDFALRRATLADVERRFPAGTVPAAADLRRLVDEAGAAKQYLICRVLRFRQGHPDLFTRGEYVPLRAVGPQAARVVAFARVLGARVAVVVVPRQLLGLGGEAGAWPVGGAVWGDTQVEVPAGCGQGAYVNVLTGETVAVEARADGGALRLAEALARFPVALLARA
ncbi:MAG: malto-oligosyltrehalose synthase [Verrucomicrobia bacterium]|nr:malto-oligosyltrehalose synthase [Verrucomicrobiota bacterium]